MTSNAVKADRARRRISCASCGGPTRSSVGICSANRECKLIGERARYAQGHGEVKSRRNDPLVQDVPSVTMNVGEVEYDRRLATVQEIIAHRNAWLERLK